METEHPAADQGPHRRSADATMYTQRMSGRERGILHNEKEAAYLSIRQAAQRLGVCPRTVGDLIRRGRLEAARISDRGRWYIRPESIDRLLTGTAAQAEQQEQR